MALPFTRHTTFAALSQITSAFLNAIQDAIIAFRNKPLEFGAYLWNGTNIGRTLPNQINQAAAGAFEARVDISPQLIAGDTIKEITWRYQNSATPTAGNIDVELGFVTVATGIASTVAASALTLDSTTGGSSAIRNVTDAVGHVVVDGRAYFLKFTCAAAPANDDVRLRGATVVLGL